VEKAGENFSSMVKYLTSFCWSCRRFFVCTQGLSAADCTIGFYLLVCTQGLSAADCTIGFYLLVCTQGLSAADCTIGFYLLLHVSAAKCSHLQEAADVYTCTACFAVC
jgi:hypothetical protein